ncbi:MAG: hypothetical protein IK116_08815 [Firmicutes bacterium]|nr:hypothetical protein [Bacillota bacterium]
MSETLSLQHPFPALSDGSRSYYGGSQKLLTRNYVRKAGCGVICAANILLYLGRHHPECGEGPFAELGREDPVPTAAFCCCCDRLQRRYLPVLPHFGLTGPQVAWGMNRYCRRYHLPYRMRWRFGRRRFWDDIASMLEQDIPPTLAIGPNFPALWGRRKLRFYRQLPDGSYRLATSVNRHFVTVTGLDGEWLRISSWGREYYVSRQELTDYITGPSAWLVSNLGLVRRV